MIKGIKHLNILCNKWVGVAEVIYYNSQMTNICAAET